MAASKKKKKEKKMYFQIQRKKKCPLHLVGKKILEIMKDFLYLENTDKLFGYLENKGTTPQKRQHTQDNHRGSLVEHPVIQIGLLYNSEPKINEK